MQFRQIDAADREIVSMLLSFDRGERRISFHRVGSDGGATSYISRGSAGVTLFRRSRLGQLEGVASRGGGEAFPFAGDLHGRERKFDCGSLEASLIIA